MKAEFIRKSSIVKYILLILMMSAVLSGCTGKNNSDKSSAVFVDNQKTIPADSPEAENNALASNKSVPSASTAPSASTTPSASTAPTTTANTKALQADASSSEGSNNTPVQGSVSAGTEAVTAADTYVNKDVHQVTLLAVGDNLIHREVIKSGKKSDGTYNFDHLYSNIKEDISAADIAVINQETVFGGDKLPYSGYPNFNSPSEIGDALVKAGFDVILQATNHAMDMSSSGLLNTIGFWKGYPDITVLGINESKEEQNEIPVIEKNGIKIAMLNYTYGLNGYSLPKNKPYLVNLLDKERMTKDIKKAKELADFVIVFPHWGTEYVYEATKTQQQITDLYYDLGVDLVIGTHPHVLEPVEWIEKEPGRRMLVYYSLGNFISFQKEAPRMLGGLADVTITKDDNGTYISEAGITPLITHFEIGPEDYNYGIYKLNDYSSYLADAHGVSEVADDGPLTYGNSYELAKNILGSWLK